MNLPDSWPGIALLFLLFVYVFPGLLGLGWIHLPSLKEKKMPALQTWGLAWLYSSFTLFLVCGGLASAGGLGWIPIWVWWALPAFGWWTLFRKNAFSFRIPPTIGIFAFVFFLRALGSASPQAHGDPLLYHLLGPRLWAEAGGFILHPNLPNAILASGWEYLYIYPQMLWMGSGPLWGLIEAQIFSQWLHLAYGGLGSCILVATLFSPIFSGFPLAMVALGAFFVSGIQWTAALAKNDAGICFWSLGAIWLLKRAQTERLPYGFFTAGIFAGLAISGKITAIFSLAPIMGLLFLTAAGWAIGERGPIVIGQKILHGFSLGWGFILGCLPVYGRNFALTENPFFPMFGNIFPSPWISETWRRHFAQVIPGDPISSLENLILRFPELGRESPWIFASILFVGLIPVTRLRELMPLFFGAWISFGIFVLTQKTEIELRYLGASLMILVGIGLTSVLFFVGKIPSPKWIRSSLVILVLALIFAFSKLPTHLLWKVWKSPLGQAQLLTHSSGEAKDWLRKNVKDGELTIVAGDNETYYLTPIPVTVLTERPDLDRATIEERDLKHFVEKICDLSGARYLLDARPEIGFGRYFDQAIQTLTRSPLIFSSQGAKIYDLVILEKELRIPKELRCGKIK